MNRAFGRRSSVDRHRDHAVDDGAEQPRHQADDAPSPGVSGDAGIAAAGKRRPCAPDDQRQQQQLPAPMMGPRALP
jgi:hypothetical protein